MLPQHCLDQFSGAPTWRNIAPTVWILIQTTIAPFATFTSATPDGLTGATISTQTTAKSRGIASIRRRPEGSLELLDRRSMHSGHKSLSQEARSE